MSLRAFSRTLATVNKQLDETNQKLETTNARTREAIRALEAARAEHTSYKDSLAAQEPALAGYLNQLDNIVKAWLTTKDAFAKNQIGEELRKAFDIINRAGFEQYIDMNKWIADVKKTLEGKKATLVKGTPKGGNSSSSSSSATSGGLVL